jgi:hypothetical protein
MNIKTINNYKINNQAIGIFKYIKSVAKFIKENTSLDKKNSFEDIIKGEVSPIKYHKDSDTISFTFKNNPKKKFIEEVINLQKYNIFILKDDMFCINPLFSLEIFSTNWDKVLPNIGIKNNYKSDIYLVTLIKNGVKNGIQIDDFGDTSFTAIFKQILFPQGFVKLEDFSGNDIPITQIYSGEREINKFLYKKKLFGKLFITDLGIKYLVDNDIYQLYDIDLTSDEEQLIYDENSYLFEKLTELNVSITIKKSIKNDFKIFLSFNNINEHLKFLKFRQKNLNLFDKYEFDFEYIR